ncbi:3'-5' exonuclease [Mycetocola tolaasinivorans]|uniref:3'-5' exonuclease n=1 Tax=Mycetocola tolaasinivorans TaxID=76635 RepID=A0A3L7A2J5_9MICO|nr:3'-5' exonuclease [Mycetocola tolaasinivorans]
MLVRGATPVSVVRPKLDTVNNTASIWTQPIAVFDLETTGIDVTTSRIVSAHVGILDAQGAVIRNHDWLADPGVEIPEQATAVHGITTERARAEGQPAALVVAEIISALRELLNANVPVVIYNAPYDLSLLHHEALRYGYAPLENPSPIVDPLVIDKAVDRFRKGKRTLEASAEFYGVSLLDAHDAASDAIAAGHVAQALIRAHAEKLEGLSAAELHAKQVDWCAEQAASFQEYMRRSKNPSFVASGEWPVR